MRNTGFLDLLFNLLLGITVLFFLSFLMIKPITKKADVTSRAEYLITMSWPDGANSDVDLWVEDPLTQTIFFRQKERNIMHLDRDDLGNSNDTVYLPDGRVIFCRRNQEQVTLRGFIAGEWVVNAHMYKLRDDGDVPVKIVIDRVNPSFRTVFAKTFIFNTQWEEQTATRFTMLSSGDIIAFDDTYKKLVNTGGAE